MRMRPGRYLFSVFLPASLMLGAGSGAAAQESHAHADAAADRPASAVRRVLWSDPAAWPEGKVPGEGDAVTIARDMEVVLDVDPPALRSLTIDGKLSFSNDLDIGLESEWIYLRGGELRSEERRVGK